MDSSRRTPNPAEMLGFAATQTSPESSKDLELDFTAVDFFDFDLTTDTNLSNLPTEFSPQNDNSLETISFGSATDFLNSGFFNQISVPTNFATLDTNPSNTIQQLTPNFLDPSSTVQQQQQQQHQHTIQSPTSLRSGSHNSKRKFADLADPQSRARAEAEEDKRRRNTAASARFRLKKKQKEQNLEKTAKEMTEKATTLENRVHELEQENGWLKGLITEKQGRLEFADMWAKYKAENRDTGVKSAEVRRLADAKKEKEERKSKEEKESSTGSE